MLRRACGVRVFQFLLFCLLRYSCKPFGSEFCVLSSCMLAHTAVSIIGDVAVDQVQKRARRRLERDPALQAKIKSVMNGFQSSAERFGSFLRRRGISPRRNAADRALTPTPAKTAIEDVAPSGEAPSGSGEGACLRGDDDQPVRASTRSDVQVARCTFDETWVGARID